MQRWAGETPARMDHSRPNTPDLYTILVEEGVLTREAAAELQQRTADAWVPLGKLLRQKGLVTMAQLLELLDAKSREPDARIGDLAVRAGYCTREQVEACFTQQREFSPHPLELLARDRNFDPLRLCHALTRYVRELDEARSSPHLPV